MSNARGSVLLRPDSYARGYRDGFSGHPPRRDANGSEEYSAGYAVGVEESARVGEWMRRPQGSNGHRQLSPAARAWNGSGDRPPGRTA